MKTLIIAFTLVLLAGCSSATAAKAKSLSPATVTPFPYLPKPAPTPFSPVMPANATMLALQSVPGSYNNRNGTPMVFPIFSASTYNAQMISVFVQDVSSFKSVFGYYCPVESGYAVQITLSDVQGQLWQGDANMDGCKDLIVGPFGNAARFIVNQEFWALLSQIAGRTLPFSPLDGD